MDISKILAIGNEIYLDDIRKYVTVENVYFNKDKNELVIKVINYPWTKEVPKPLHEDNDGTQHIPNTVTIINEYNIFTRKL
jgi:hypothetical protein